MSSRFYKLLLLIFLGVNLSTSELHAQLVNSGDLYIQDGTILWTSFPFENTSTGNIINNGTLVFTSDVLNDGQFAFSTDQTTGLTRLEGNTSQTIGGISPILLSSLQLNNSEGYNLDNSLSVAGTAEFNSGIVRSSSPSNTFSFTPSGVSENSSDDSFVDGVVGFETDTERLYPIGDDSYRRIMLASPINQAETLNLQGRYFLEDPDNLYPRDQTSPEVTLVSDAEYWELNNLNPSVSELNLTLSWRDITTSAFVLGNLTKLAIVKWDEDQQLWVTAGGISDLENQLISTEISLSGTGVYTLGVLTGITNLGLTKTSFGISIWEGDQFEYELVLQNNGQDPATDVVLVDNLPDELEYISVEGESIFGLLEFDVEVLGQTVVIRIPELIVGDEVTFKLRVRASDPGRIINTAEVTSLEVEEDPEDNFAMDENEVKAFFIPNAITPNRDGFNDQFEIKGLNKFISNKLTIFTRYGDTVLEKENYENDWKAEDLVAGTYFYVLNVIEEDGTPQTFKGWIQVIRQD